MKAMLSDVTEKKLDQNTREKCRVTGKRLAQKLSKTNYSKNSFFFCCFKIQRKIGRTNGQK